MLAYFFLIPNLTTREAKRREREREIDIEVERERDDKWIGDLPRQLA
jgi:hypothetical protein